MPLTSDVWHVGELPGDDGRTVRDANGLTVCVASSAAEAQRIAQLPELMNRADALANVSTYDDEFTDQDEHDAAHAPLRELLDQLAAEDPQETRPHA